MSFSDEFDRDLRQYCDQTKKDCIKIAKQVQAHMLAEIPSRTPVGQYTPGDRKNEKGHLRDSWIKGTIKLKDGRGMLYGVRSESKPSLVHLVNFPHRIAVIEAVGSGSSRLLYRADRGMTKGDPFVDEVQDEGVKMLDELLERYFNG